MKAFQFFASILALSAIATACGKKGPSADLPLSTFEGIWLGTDIEEYRKNKDPKFICDNIENDQWTGHKNELRIDGYVINRKGFVFDFKLNGTDPVPMWKVRSDGSTYDNMILKHRGRGQNTSNLIGLSMKKMDTDRIASEWQWKENDGRIQNGHVEYLRSSTAEIAEIRKIVSSCPAKP